MKVFKRLKNIEDRSNNKLLAIKNIPRPAIKGENNGDVNDQYKTIQDFKEELINKNILHLDGVEKFDNGNGNKLKIKKLFIKTLILKFILKNLTYIKFLKTI